MEQAFQGHRAPLDRGLPDTAPPVEGLLRARDLKAVSRRVDFGGSGGRLPGFSVYVAVVNLALPVPVLLRVLSVITVVLVVPVYLAVEFEPPKTRAPGQT